MLHPVFLRQPGPRWFGGRSTKNFLLPATPWRHRHEQVRGLDRAVIEPSLGGAGGARVLRIRCTTSRRMWRK
jgi:hypothetical protein